MRFLFRAYGGLLSFASMAGITLAIAQEHLTIWLEAEKQVALGQSYQIGNRMLTRANLNQIREQVKFWQGQVDELSATGGQRGVQLFGATPLG